MHPRIVIPLTNPKVVIEILSESTEHYDRTFKIRRYKQLPTLMEYIVVSQDEPPIERFIRLPDGTWAQTDFVGLDVTMTLSTVPVTLPLSDAYLGVEFPDPDPSSPKSASTE